VTGPVSFLSSTRERPLSQIGQPSINDIVRVGVIVNPIAGMGGSVGLKGTDGVEVLEEARRRGARPSASQRMTKALQTVSSPASIDFLSCDGEMGGEALRALNVPFVSVYRTSTPTSAATTRQLCEAFLANKVDVVIFAGGDGTARDILDAIGLRIPVVGVPAGVKMHSAAFAVTPQAAGRLLSEFVEGKADVRESEVMDVDEEAFRHGRLSARLYGYLLTPCDRELVQPIKGEVEGPDLESEKEELAEQIVDLMERGTLYILGPGTTLATVAKALGSEKTLLGVDLFLNRSILEKDVTERRILEAIITHPHAKIVVTPIGSQGFILGRGNQQLSPEVVRRVGIENILIVSTPSKLSTFWSLRSDSGDPDLDSLLKGYRKVLVGRGRWRLVPLA